MAGGGGVGAGKEASAEPGFLPVLRALVGRVVGVAGGAGALALRSWASRLGCSFGVAAAIWEYAREALAVAALAADAMLRAVEAACWAEEATCLAWSAVALTLRIVAWISSSFLTSAN